MCHRGRRACLESLRGGETPAFWLRDSIGGRQGVARAMHFSSVRTAERSVALVPRPRRRGRDLRTTGLNDSLILSRSGRQWRFWRRMVSGGQAVTFLDMNGLAVTWEGVWRGRNSATGSLVCLVFRADLRELVWRGEHNGDSARAGPRVTLFQLSRNSRAAAWEELGVTLC